MTESARCTACGAAIVENAAMLPYKGSEMVRLWQDQNAKYQATIAPYVSGQTYAQFANRGVMEPVIDGTVRT